MNKVVEKIAEEIGVKGAIPFARFMELALYCPVYGYYEKEEDTIGRRGDYYTSASVGSLFGELLACQFAEWLLQCGVSGPDRVWQIVEAGAHRGELAGDILRWMRQQRPELFQCLEYWVVEPSERRQEWQQERLAEFAGKVRWARNLTELEQGVRGVVFSNELLDALPARRLGWDARRQVWFEWGVKMEGARFAWTRMEESAMSAMNIMGDMSELQAVLPDGFTIEVCPAATQWWREAASVLECGRLVAIDYGLTRDELLLPERKEGTLRAYYRHRLSPDVLAHAGEQDITAHVDFTAIQQAGEAAGLQTVGFLTQAQFLTGIAARIWSSAVGFGPWIPQHTRQFQTLTHPEHLGRAFRVLVQARG